MERSVSRAETESRLQEERRLQERRRNVVVLMMYHLLEHGYVGALEALQAESGLRINDHVLADNVDLLAVVQEHEAYFEMRFDKKPRLVKKAPGQGAELPVDKAGSARRGLPRAPGAPERRPSGACCSAADAARRASPASAGSSAGGGKPPLARGASGASSATTARDDADGGADGTLGGLVVTGAVANGCGPAGVPAPAGGAEAAARAIRARGAASEEGGGVDGAAGADHWDLRLRKALPPSFLAHSELRDLGGWIMRDVVQSNPTVGWSDIAELGGVKRVLSESLVLPLKYPEHFTGLLSPWKGVLLYGPPGTGKTMLAKAVASECDTTFFNVSASTIVSKWRGDSEKLVRCLFELARYHSPSTVFIDEVDSIMGARGDGGEHEGSRRMKTELLVQMDGLQSSSDQAFVLAATNLPWELDNALLRRLEKRILVPRPGEVGRRVILHKLLPPDRVERGCDLDAIAAQTDGYSGSDLVLVCKEAAMAPLRRLLAQLEEAEARAGGGGGADGGARPVSIRRRQPALATAGAAGKPAAPQPTIGRVTAEDVAVALSRTRPTAADSSKYDAWAAEFGST
ncbi:hypothetical protein KFE25_004976 [Diacronema lutheri]|uniref:AAA+ ATPase domain-containing protein n=1 Tax=Diacronema lutheri TaxID=2081491 RepID=A0A8J5XQ84_DIALT|nr:hypothetical protein KFE25_004976 [Diacronema lutheri]